MTEDEAIARCLKLGASMAAHREALTRESAERRELIIALHEQCGMTYRALAKVLSISSPRVAQIINNERGTDEQT